ncbi:13552_t:CDS:2, partial [Acaulospora morrowiae]
STSSSSAALQHQALRPELYGEFEQNGEKESDIKEIEEHRWKALFEEFFLDNSDNKHDDLLFFVRKDENEDLDPVFVKRKPTQRGMSQLEVDDEVLWKETFYLNLIVQLTVAVCKRSTDESNGPTQKTSMVCSNKHVSKRVYALPTKSRMDIKEASMECSYPLIYYVIDDYEDMFEHLIVTEGEYLCVELAATIKSKSNDDEDLSDMDNESDDDYYNGPAINRRNHRHRRSMTNGPFPQPNDTKITFFQGAAPYTSLVDIYKQKTASKLNRRFKMGPVTPPTEYVMMRGPAAKGHAQVAITATSINDEDILDIANPPSFSLNNTSGNGNYNTLQSTQNGGTSNRNSQTISATSLFQTLKKISQSITDKSSTDPESLKCCMTFVNVRWDDIIRDLVAYTNKQRS